MQGLTKKFFQDPIGAILLILVIAATATREGGVIPDPWDKVVGSCVALLYAFGFVTRSKKEANLKKDDE